MEPTDLTIHILREIRDEIRADREQQRQFNEDQRKFNEDQRKFNEDQRKFNEDQRKFNELALQRFGLIETALRDLAEQMVMLSRGIKVAIESKVEIERRVEVPRIAWRSWSELGDRFPGVPDIPLCIPSILE